MKVKMKVNQCLICIAENNGYFDWSAFSHCQLQPVRSSRFHKITWAFRGGTCSIQIPITFLTLWVLNKSMNPNSLRTPESCKPARLKRSVLGVIVFLWITYLITCFVYGRVFDGNKRSRKTTHNHSQTNLTNLKLRIALVYFGHVLTSQDDTE